MFENVFFIDKEEIVLRNEVCFVIPATRFYGIVYFFPFLFFLYTFDFVIDLTIKTIHTKRKTCWYLSILYLIIMVIILLKLAIVKQEQKDKVLALVNQFVDLSNKHDNNQNGIDSIVLMHDDACEEEIKKVNSHSNGCMMHGLLDDFIASCAGDNCKKYQNLDGVLNLCLETKESQDEKKDSDDNKKDDSIKNGVSSNHVHFDVALLNENVIIKLKEKIFSDLGCYKDNRYVLFRLMFELFEQITNYECRTRTNCDSLSRYCVKYLNHVHL